MVIRMVLVASVPVEKMEQRACQQKCVGSPPQCMGPVLPQYEERGHDPQRYDEKQPFPIQFHVSTLPG